MNDRTFSQSLNPLGKPINPSFSVHKNGTIQTTITGAQKITWSTEEFDTNNNFASDKFTPTVPGKYLLAASLMWTGLNSGDELVIYLYKNGVKFKAVGANIGGFSDPSTHISVVVDANGTTDYFEIYGENTFRDTSNVYGVISDTWFTGCKID